MQDFFFCQNTQLSVHKGDSTVHPTEIRKLKVRYLLEHRVKAFGLPVKVEDIDGERIRFEFKGADHGKSYGHNEPAENLLKGVVHLGTYYDRGTGQLYF